MSNRNHRFQKSDEVSAEDTRPLVVRPLEGLDDRTRNPDDIEVDEVAIANGPTHGGTDENRAELRAVRGSGGRKRSGNFTHHHAGKDTSKKR